MAHRSAVRYTQSYEWACGMCDYLEWSPERIPFYQEMAQVYAKSLLQALDRIDEYNTLLDEYEVKSGY
ncbi:MAG: hypothetical protein ACRCZS_12805 [Chroococcidiopsis sp.]